MIQIEKMLSLHLMDVVSLKVSDEQIKFVGSIDEILAIANAQIRPHVMVVNGHVVGFFLIDTVYAKDNDFVTPNSLGLRKFFIGTQYQGKGYAKQVLQLLPEYLATHYSNYNHVFLTVNCKNDHAKQLYLNCGFQDTNALYLGGPSGPQHVMKLAI